MELRSHVRFAASGSFCAGVGVGRRCGCVCCCVRRTRRFSPLLRPTSPSSLGKRKVGTSISSPKPKRHRLENDGFRATNWDVDDQGQVRFYSIEAAETTNLGLESVKVEAAAPLPLIKEEVVVEEGINGSDGSETIQDAVVSAKRQLPVGVSIKIEPGEEYRFNDQGEVAAGFYSIEAAGTGNLGGEWEQVMEAAPLLSVIKEEVVQEEQYHGAVFTRKQNEDYQPAPVEVSIKTPEEEAEEEFALALFKHWLNTVVPPDGGWFYESLWIPDD
uniref:Uncharacterized protein n=1 Tax=Linum usitatissimum TaxID=4006 RepID=A0A172MLB3_LINUS|nr:hypothetical protein [Linum usitatissimum]